MAAILNSAILNSAFLHSTILHKKNFTHSFLLNLMMAAILNSAILNSAILDSTILHKTLTQTNSMRLKLIHSHLNWWWQPSWILPSRILPFCTKLQFKPIQSDSNSFIPTQLDDGSLLQFGHLGFNHLSFTSHTHSHLPRMVPTICTKRTYSHFPPHHLHKKTSLIHSDSTWWWELSWILPCWIQTLPSRIQTPCNLLSDSLKNTLTPLWLWIKLIQ